MNWEIQLTGPLRFVIIKIVSDQLEVSLLKLVTVQVLFLQFTLAFPSSYKKVLTLGTHISYQQWDLLLVIIDLLSWLKSY